jgi:hypothetical protein
LSNNTNPFVVASTDSPWVSLINNRPAPRVGDFVMFTSVVDGQPASYRAVVTKTSDLPKGHRHKDIDVPYFVALSVFRLDHMAQRREVPFAKDNQPTVGCWHW